MMLKIEAEAQEAQVAGSLMDRVLMGMIAHIRTSPFPPHVCPYTSPHSLTQPTPPVNTDTNTTPPPREDYLETLLRDPTSSHLVEVLVLISLPAVFSAIWATHIVG